MDLSSSVYKWLAGALLSLSLLMVGYAWGNTRVTEHSSEEGHPVTIQRLNRNEMDIREIRARISTLLTNQVHIKETLARIEEKVGR